MKKQIMLVMAIVSLMGCTNSIDQHSVQVGKMGDMSITDMRSAVVNNLLVAQTTFHNSGNQSKTGFYRCQFYDANKMQVGDVQLWQPITIYPNEDQVVKCMATQVEATEFKVEFSADGSNVSIYKYK